MNGNGNKKKKSYIELKEKGITVPIYISIHKYELNKKRKNF